MRMPLAIRVSAAGIFVALAATSCVGTGIDDYDDFRSAVDSGANCEQLLDMRSNFDDRPGVQEKIDADLAEIGCMSADSERTDE